MNDNRVQCDLTESSELSENPCLLHTHVSCIVIPEVEAEKEREFENG